MSLDDAMRWGHDRSRRSELALDGERWHHGSMGRRHKTGAEAANEGQQGKDTVTGADPADGGQQDKPKAADAHESDPSALEAGEHGDAKTQPVTARSDPQELSTLEPPAANAEPWP